MNATRLPGAAHFLFPPAEPGPRQHTPSYPGNMSAVRTAQREGLLPGLCGAGEPGPRRARPQGVAGKVGTGMLSHALC